MKAVYSNIYYFDKKTNKKKSKFDKISRDFRYIPRANNPEKALSKSARILASNYHDMISKTPNKIIFVSHEFISNLTEVGNRQNNRIHNELLDLFHIQYHKSVFIDNKKYHYGFTVQFTESTEIILKDPQLFYASKLSQYDQSSGQKCPLNTTKMSTHTIYKELENPLEEIEKESTYSFSISKKEKKLNKKKKKLTSGVSSLAEHPKVSLAIEIPPEEIPKMQVNLEPYIFDAFGNEQGQEIIKICTVDQISSDRVSIQIKQGKSLQDEEKQRLRTCIQAAYGENVQITTPRVKPLVIAAKEDKPSTLPIHQNYDFHLWNEFKKGIRDQFELKRVSHFDHMFAAWFDKLNRTQNIAANKLILTGNDFMVDYIYGQFERFIETAAIEKKINVELVYEANNYPPILFTPTGRKF